MKYSKPIKTLICFIIIIFCGIYCISFSLQLDENVNNTKNYIRIGILTEDYYNNCQEKKPLYVSGFLLFYDFSENKGKVSFNSGGGINHTFNRIYFGFFTPIEIIDIYAITNVSTGRPEHRVDFNYSLNGNKTTDHSKSYVLKKFNSQKRNNFSFTPINKTFKGETIVVEFKSDFEPGGIFYILPDNYNELQRGFDVNGNINFLLGNGYEIDKSSSYFQRIEESLLSSKSNIKLLFIEENNNNRLFIKNTNDILFKLNVINKDIERDKAFYLTLGISFITFGISMFINFIININFYKIFCTIYCKFSKNFSTNDICKKLKKFIVNKEMFFSILIVSVIFYFILYNSTFKNETHVFLFKSITEFSIVFLGIFTSLRLYKESLLNSITKDVNDEKLNSLNNDTTLIIITIFITIICSFILSTYMIESEFNNFKDNLAIMFLSCLILVSFIRMLFYFYFFSKNIFT